MCVWEREWERERERGVVDNNGLVDEGIGYEEVREGKEAKSVFDMRVKNSCFLCMVSFQCIRP